MKKLNEHTINSFESRHMEIGAAHSRYYGLHSDIHNISRLVPARFDSGAKRTTFANILSSSYFSLGQASTALPPLVHIRRGNACKKQRLNICKNTSRLNQHAKSNKASTYPCASSEHSRIPRLRTMNIPNIRYTLKRLFVRTDGA